MIRWMFKLSDPHLPVHFFGCGWLFFALRLFVEDMTAGIITALLGIVWEILDYFNCKLDWKNRLLDPRGADISDILVDFAGIGLSWCVVWFSMMVGF